MIAIEHGVNIPQCFEQRVVQLARGLELRLHGLVRALFVERVLFDRVRQRGSLATIVDCGLSPFRLQLVQDFRQLGGLLLIELELVAEVAQWTTYPERAASALVRARVKSCAASGGSTDRAVDFDVEITLDKPPAGIRPDLSATARIVTDTRKQSLSIPIIALMSAMAMAPAMPP